MDYQQDWIKPWNAFIANLSTNCQSLDLATSVAKHTQSHVEFRTQLMPCPYCRNKIVGNRLHQHISRKHSQSLGNDFDGKADQYSNEPNFDYTQWRNNPLWDRPRKTYLQTSNTASQMMPSAWLISTGDNQSLDASRKEVSDKTFKDVDEPELQSNEQYQNCDEDQCDSLTPIESIVASPQTPPMENQTVSEDEKKSTTLSATEDSHFANETADDIVQQEQADFQVKMPLTSDQIEDCQNTDGDHIDASVSNEEPVSEPLLDDSTSTNQLPVDFQTDELLTEQHQHTDIDQPEVTVSNKAVIPCSEPLQSEEQNISEVDGKQPNSSISNLMTDNANSAKKRKHSESSVRDSSNEGQMKKRVFDDVNQNHPNILNESTPEKPPNVTQAKGNEDHSSLTTQRGQSFDRTENDIMKSTLADNQHRVSTNVVQHATSTSVGSTNDTIVLHPQVPPRQIQTDSEENRKLAEISRFQRKNYHPVYINEYVLNRFMQEGFIRVHNGKLFVHEE